MAKLALGKFSGIAPIIRPRYLQESQAQIAEDCATWLGPLVPLKNTLYMQPFAKTGDITSIYRFGADANETDYWFHWEQDVDVARGFINDDVTERTFYTGDGIPKVTDNTLALAGVSEAYPVNSYQLGIPPPDTTPICTVIGTGDEADVAETRAYTYTYVNSWGEESAPYTEETLSFAAQVDVKPGQTVDVSFPPPPSGNFNVTARRLYRSVLGTGSVEYLFVAELPIATPKYNDSVEAENLGESLTSLSYLPPPEDLQGLVAMPNGIFAGFVGQDLYFSVPYRPYAWPLQYQMSVGYPIVGLGVIDTTLVVLTTGRPYFVQGSTPDLMTMIEADVSQACVSKRSIVSMNGVVFYASPDGLVGLAPGGSKIISQQIMDKTQWQDYGPSTINAFLHDGKYIAFYDNGTKQAGFIFDPQRNVFVNHSVYATGGYADLKNDTLYLVVDNTLHKWEAGADLEYTWKSKKFTLAGPLSMSCYRIDAEQYPVKFELYRDGELIVDTWVQNDNIVRLPAGRGKEWEFTLTGIYEVFAVKIGQSPGEISYE